MRMRAHTINDVSHRKRAAPKCNSRLRPFIFRPISCSDRLRRLLPFACFYLPFHISCLLHIIFAVTWTQFDDKIQKVLSTLSTIICIYVFCKAVCCVAAPLLMSKLMRRTLSPISLMRANFRLSQVDVTTRKGFQIFISPNIIVNTKSHKNWK